MEKVLRKKILIVDDDVEMAVLMRDILEPVFEVMMAHDGIQAIQRTKEGVIDLILLDVRMPFFSGFWFCDAFKQKSDTKNIPIIFVSGLSGEDNVEKAKNLGVCAYLQKPFLPEQLVEVVNTAFA